VTAVFKNLISPVLFAAIDPLEQEFYVVSNNLEEATVSLKNGKIISIDPQKSTFLHTPYNFSIQ
jgi:hypothetical protein